MPRRGKVVVTSRGDARLYVAKAEQFLAEAREAEAAGRRDAAMLTAIHAAICGADAVTVALAGRRSADPDHQRAADLLEEVAGRSQPVKTHARQLRTLLSRKNTVEYEARLAAVEESYEALRRAARIVSWAREVVDRSAV